MDWMHAFLGYDYYDYFNHSNDYWAFVKYKMSHKRKKFKRRMRGRR